MDSVREKALHALRWFAEMDSDVENILRVTRYHGYSLSVISRVSGMNRAKLRNICDGVEPVADVRDPFDMNSSLGVYVRLKKQRNALVAQAVRHGATANSIADILGISTRQVWRILEKERGKK